ECVGGDGKAVVLGRDVDAPVLVTDRLVGAAVPELHLVGLASEPEAADLVPHANPINRKGPREVFYAPDGIGGMDGVSGAVADEESVGAAGHDLVGRAVVGEDMEVRIAVPQADNHVLFYPKVDDRDPLSSSGNV